MVLTLDGRNGLTELEELDGIFSALAHEQRRQILLALHLRGGRVRAGEIAARFACSWPTTTRHLKVLQSAGLVAVEKSGRERFYSVDLTLLDRVLGGWLGYFESSKTT